MDPTGAAGITALTNIDVRIESIAAGGDGIARHEGVVVFVPRTAPDDLVRVSAVQAGRLMRGTLLEVLERSSQRIDPPCAHYTEDKCGGCQIQHLDYERSQLPAKSRIIGDALNRIGRAGIAHAPEVE